MKIRNQVTILVFAAALTYTLILVNRHNSKTEEAFNEVAEAEQPAQTRLQSRIGEARALRNRDPEKALALFKKIATQSANSQERFRAQTEIPITLAGLYKQMKRRRDPAMETVYMQLREDHPDAPATEEIAASWSRDRVQLLKWLLNRKDWHGAERLFAILLDQPDEIHMDNILSQYRDFKLQRFNVLKQSGQMDMARECLMDAASVFPFGRNQVGKLWYKQDPGQDWLKTGRQFMQMNRYGQACAAFYAAEQQLRQQYDRKKQAQVSALINQCLWQLAGELSAFERPGSGFKIARSTYQNIRATREPDSRYKLARAKMMLDAAAADQAMGDGRFRDAENFYNQVLTSHTRQVWTAKTWDTGYDLLSEVPPQVAEKVKQQNPKNYRDRSRSILQKMLQNKEWTPPWPELARVRAALPELYTQWGLSLLDKQRSEAFVKWRPVLREHAGTSQARRIRDALQAKLETCARNKSFEAIFDLAGYYVAEIGVDPSDAFRDTLKRLLDQLANHYRSRSPMKYIFMLALMSDIFPDTQAGKWAFTEALKKGFDHARSVTSRMQPQERTLPANLGDLSVLCVENGTPHHLLIFFKGPESFFVRLDPSRRGSIVLKNGQYENAVIITDDSVRPFHGKLAFQSQTRFSRYVIQSSHSNYKPLLMGNYASQGKFKLLRQPPATGPFQVHPESGQVSAASL